MMITPASNVQALYDSKNKKTSIMKNLAFLSVWIFLLAGCDIIDAYIPQEQESKGMEMVETSWSPDRLEFTVGIKMNDSLPFCILTDTTNVHIKTTEWSSNINIYPQATQPRLVGITDIRYQALEEMNLKALALVDLTLPPQAVKAEQAAMRNLSAIFRDDLYVAFMRNGAVSETMPATGYVLDHFFGAQDTVKSLYRSILCKLDEMNARPSRYYPWVKQDRAIWKDGSPSQQVMLILSDGKVYDGDVPTDPDHYELEQALVQATDLADNPYIYYFNYADSTEVADNPHSMLELVCRQTGGSYFGNSEWKRFINDLLQKTGNFETPKVDYLLTYHNPAYKVYDGESSLEIECLAGDSLYAFTKERSTLGSLYRPIILYEKPFFQIILQGILVGGWLVLFAWFIMQWILPYIRYRIFRKKYIIRYTSANMVCNDRLVDTVCYYCKTPFKKGDSIVVKCKHTLHESCWDENEYKCPEYGRQCRHGAHYYNRMNLFDPHNASFYQSWILFAILAGTLAWLEYMVYTIYSDTKITEQIISMFNLQPYFTEKKFPIGKYWDKLSHTPFYIFCLCQNLVFFLGYLSSHGRLFSRIRRNLFNSVLVGAVAYILFALNGVISIKGGIDNIFNFFDILFWYIICLFISLSIYHDDRRGNIRYILKSSFISMLYGYSSIFLIIFIDDKIEPRMLFLCCILLFSVGQAICFAFSSPKSERYFLRIAGPVKEMDIALYKWMNAPMRAKHVCIGSSVSCDLHMSWEAGNRIAPRQADIYIADERLYITALDEGMLFRGKPLKPGARKRLYPRDTFTIGETTFTCVEKDV
jgi:hypothetical protein